MSARIVFDWVLNELEAGNAGGVEGEMIGAPGVPHGERIHSQIFEGTHPCFEDRLHSGIPLHVDAANLSRAIVDVEVRGNFGLFWLYRHRSGFSAPKARRAILSGAGERWTRTEMVHYVPLGAEQTLFFAAPQPDANGAARFNTECLENANRFHHHDRSGAVVGRARATVP